MNTTTTKAVRIEPIIASSGYGGTELVVLGYVPQSASEWDYALPGSGKAVAHFGPAAEGSKLLALYPVPNQIGDSFYSLTPADLAEMQVVAREALADPDPDYAV